MRHNALALTLLAALGAAPARAEIDLRSTGVLVGRLGERTLLSLPDGTRTGVEVWREREPAVGRAVRDASGRAVDIEWREGVELRVRVESGRALSADEQAAVRRDLGTCARGRVVDAEQLVERSGTYVLRFGCARLQSQ